MAQPSLIAARYIITWVEAHVKRLRSMVLKFTLWIFVNDVQTTKRGPHNASAFGRSKLWYKLFRSLWTKVHQIKCACAGEIAVCKAFLRWTISPDRWRHVTLECQGRDPKMFGAHYLENDWRYSLCNYNRAPIGNGTWSIKWSHDRWRHWSVNRNLGMFGREIGSLEKRHCIAQTPCS